ncbi:MAG: helicase HerA-like domain-containing protein [Pseudoclavibacter sp.]
MAEKSTEQPTGAAAPEPAPASTEEAAPVPAPQPAAAQAAQPNAEQTDAAQPAAQPSTNTASGPLSQQAVDAVRAGYTFEGTTLDIGALVNGEPLKDVQVRIPLGMLNRHGLIAGATGTGKTKTLQGLAEQIAANGVPVFAADIKGDLSGLAVAGTPSDKLTTRTQGIGQDWHPVATPTEFFSLGGVGQGVPLRATVDGFGPTLLARVLDLNETQESSLGLVFHYAKQNDLPLITLDDLRTLLSWLTGDEGKAELKGIGGLSPQTAGVILREIVNFAGQGADVFFGQPAVEVTDFLRTASATGADGATTEFGVVSMLEVPGVQDRPAVFSTFLMYLLTELFRALPEVGDQDKPKLVFFFDEAHLLFKGASKSFVETITQTVRLIRSKGVGIFFVTQTPKDVPGDVLGQLGSRIQHALRAHTPDDAKALKATVSTYPTSEYQLGEVLTQLGTGEAIVTVINDKGAPTPVAWTRVRAPQGSMDPMPADAMSQAIASSPLQAKYGTPAQTEGAAAKLQGRIDAASQAASDAAAAKQADADAKAADRAERERQRDEAARERESRSTSRSGSRTAKEHGVADVIDDVVKSRTFQTVVREVIRGIFGGKKR